MSGISWFLINNWKMCIQNKWTLNNPNFWHVRRHISHTQQEAFLVSCQALCVCCTEHIQLTYQPNSHLLTFWQQEVVCLLCQSFSPKVFFKKKHGVGTVWIKSVQRKVDFMCKIGAVPLWGCGDIVVLINLTKFNMLGLICETWAEQICVQTEVNSSVF